MSDWFRSVPHGFDAVANAAKFQQETMASQIRYYKAKYAQHRALLERFKAELPNAKALKREVDELRAENNQLRQYAGYGPRHQEGAQPSDSFNSNGKRPMTASRRLRRSHGGTSSSPHSNGIPVGPSRLTLPAGQQAPSLSAHQEDNRASAGASGGNSSDSYQHQIERPGTGRFIEQYAYAPPQTQQFQAQVLSHAQAAPLRQAHARGAPEQHRRTMLPPTQQANTNLVPGRQTQGGGPYSTPRPGPPPNRDRRSMAPPSMPPPMQAQGQPRLLQSNSVQATPQSNRRLQPAGSNRFKPPGTAQRFVPPTPSTNQQRFMPALGPSSGSRAPSRAAAPGGQRMPFVPGAQGTLR
ncbi:hypothetical protein PLICRDRAFT_698749 [Plicaturopsis crispa FD-325 SS-3]|nr:hypothetical protein PLICRDRAFT_698749 [Plicaturopsis crispa FD-325 SS-3]